MDRSIVYATSEVSLRNYALKLEEMMKYFVFNCSNECYYVIFLVAYFKLFQRHANSTKSCQFDSKIYYCLNLHMFKYVDFAHISFEFSGEPFLQLNFFFTCNIHSSCVLKEGIC